MIASLEAFKVLFYKDLVDVRGLPIVDLDRYIIVEEKEQHRFDSFRHVTFPKLRFSNCSMIYQPEVSLEGLDAHLKQNCGIEVAGPELQHPGLLAERKYFVLIFEEVTNSHKCRVNHSQSEHYQPFPFRQSNSYRLKLVVEDGLANQSNKMHRFYIPAEVSRDSDLQELKREVNNHLVCSSIPKESRGCGFVYNNYWSIPLFVATSPQDCADLGAESQWRNIEHLSLEEFADVVWTCLVQKRPLRTIRVPESEVKWMEKRAIEKKEAETKQENMHKEVSTNFEE